MDNEQLVARIRAGVDVADNMFALWQNNRGIIARMARRHGCGVEEEDLKQEGYIALCDAVAHYDASEGVPFINYATYWIRSRMRRYRENCGGVVRIPTHAVEDVRKYKRTVREFAALYGREPTDGETGALLGVGREKLEEIRKAAEMGQIRSLEEPIQLDSSEISLYEVIPSDVDVEEDVIRRLDAAAMSRELWEAVGRLPEEQQDIIRARYMDGETFRTIGDGKGLTIFQAKGKHDKAMTALRNSRSVRTFRRYYEQYLSAAPVRHVGVERFKTTWTSEVERAVIG